MGRVKPWRISTEQTAGSCAEPPVSLTWLAYKSIFDLDLNPLEGGLGQETTDSLGTTRVQNVGMKDQKLWEVWLSFSLLQKPKDWLMHSAKDSGESSLLTLALGETQVSHQVHPRQTAAQQSSPDSRDPLVSLASQAAQCSHPSAGKQAAWHWGLSCSVLKCHK